VELGGIKDVEVEVDHRYSMPASSIQSRTGVPSSAKARAGDPHAGRGQCEQGREGGGCGLGPPALRVRVEGRWRHATVIARHDRDGDDRTDLRVYLLRAGQLPSDGIDHLTVITHHPPT